MGWSTPKVGVRRAFWLLRNWRDSQDYGVVDMLDYLGLRQPAPAPTQSMEATMWQLVANAPPGAVYMLDSRIPLPKVDPADRRWPGKTAPRTADLPAGPCLPFWPQPQPAGK